MTTSIETCPIWGNNYRASGYIDQATRTWVVENSHRAGGGYEIGQIARNTVKELDDSEKARLTTILIDLRALGVERPKVTDRLIEDAKSKSNLPVHVRAERLLRLFVERSREVNDHINVEFDEAVGWAACAWSESQTIFHVYYFNEYLAQKGWVELRSDARAISVSVDGYSHVEDLATNVDSSQAFVAMWFSEELNAVFEQGIKPAIEKAGYKPMRIDQKADLNEIDDEIIGEIRRSRFLVADFTHGECGARGSVYFEAGFALGLNIPVIFCCRSGIEPHFDTQQYYHIFWRTPEELRSELLPRVLARIGEGPEIGSS